MSAAALQFRLVGDLGEVPCDAWNALLAADATPFVDHRFLHALEASGAAGPAHGWSPRHLTLWRGGALVGAAPAYVKHDSDGDFSRDWNWAAAAAEAGLPYYPKLVIGVPFTPVSGRRLLTLPGEDAAEVAEQLLVGARVTMRREGLGGVHVLYASADEAARLSALGLAARTAFQYHWHNRGYRDEDEFYQRFTAKRRTALKRERAAPAKQGIDIRTVRGEALARDHENLARAAHALHRSTVDKLMWGRRWLNLSFYERIFSTMPEHLEVVTAEREGRLIAGAFNVSSPTRLFGRYWGCFEEHPFLHFNVCLYHSIKDCIARGLTAFEGGAGGEHKIARGFEPSETYSAHLFAHPGFAAAMARHIALERDERERALEAWRAESPIFKKECAAKDAGGRHP